MQHYRVKVTFKHPAWDELNGLSVHVLAESKSDAIRKARREIADAGHLGVIYFKAQIANEDI